MPAPGTQPQVSAGTHGFLRPTQSWRTRQGQAAADRQPQPPANKGPAGPTATVELGPFARDTKSSFLRFSKPLREPQRRSQSWSRGSFGKAASSAGTSSAAPPPLPERLQQHTAVSYAKLRDSEPYSEDMQTQLHGCGAGGGRKWGESPALWPESTQRSDASVRSASELQTSPCPPPARRSDRVTPLLLTACLSSDQKCAELLGDHAFRALPVGQGGSASVPKQLCQACGTPSVLNQLPLESTERIAGLAKLLHLVQQCLAQGGPECLRPADQPAEFPEGDPPWLMIPLRQAGQCFDDPVYAAICERPDYWKHRNAENQKVRALLRQSRGLAPRRRRAPSTDRQSECDRTETSEAPRYMGHTIASAQARGRAATGYQSAAMRRSRSAGDLLRSPSWGAPRSPWNAGPSGQPHKAWDESPAGWLHNSAGWNGPRRASLARAPAHLPLSDLPPEEAAAFPVLRQIRRESQESIWRTESGRLWQLSPEHRDPGGAAASEQWPVPVAQAGAVYGGSHASEARSTPPEMSPPAVPPPGGGGA
eukprot:TRINITY_DN12835_c0_g2_i1.p1 TRINITY_DN12835_c0_g2~~TRINITY_DN12835_c0_g2_i1.p1  ORF type:complete len:537 (+),score=86.07 TRINITY_DN12835_c0_g2_i1:83-1693(+)